MLLDGSLNWWSVSYQTECWDIAPPYHFISSQPLNCRLTNALFSSLSIWIKHFRCSQTDLLYLTWAHSHCGCNQVVLSISLQMEGKTDWDHEGQHHDEMLRSSGDQSVGIHRDDRINQSRRKKRQSSDRSNSSEQEVTRLNRKWLVWTGSDSSVERNKENAPPGQVLLESSACERKFFGSRASCYCLFL